MSEHTPGPWRWGEDADRAQEQIDKEEFEGEKYMDTQLFGANGREIIPVRIDHYEMIYDGDWISDADRALIAAAPEMFGRLEQIAAIVKDSAEDNLVLTRRSMKAIGLAAGWAIAKAKGE